jgi:hypothetical protein
VPVQVLDEFSDGVPGGCCFVCRAARRPGDRVLDFFVDVEELGWTFPKDEYPGWEVASGYLQICATCVREAARLIGMADEDMVTEAWANIEAREARIKELTAERDVATRALEAMTDYRRTMTGVAAP